MKQTAISLIAITLCCTSFCMEEKKEFSVIKLEQRNCTKSIKTTPQSVQKPILKTDPPLYHYLKNECKNFLCTVLCCGCCCTVASYGVKYAVQSLEGIK